MRWLYICMMGFVLAACGGNKTQVVLAPENFSGIVERIKNNQANSIHALVVWQNNEKLVEIFREGEGDMVIFRPQICQLVVMRSTMFIR